MASSIHVYLVLFENNAADDEIALASVEVKAWTAEDAITQAWYEVDFRWTIEEVRRRYVVKRVVPLNK